jgi:general secretion pathway protein F
MHYELKVYRHEEGVISLLVEAASAEEASRASSEQGFKVVHIREVGRWKIVRHKERPFDLLLFTQELRSLLEAGLSLIESLGALARKEFAGDKRRLIEALIRHLREGKPLSGALKEFPAIFPPLYVALTSASEQTGDLQGALGRFIEYRERMDSVKKRLTSAMIYPALLLGVGGFVILFLMTYVVPRFSRVYEEFGAELPFMSRLLLQWGGLVEAHGFKIVVVLVVAVAVAAAILRRRAIGWRTILRRMLRWKFMAGVRERFRTYSMARFFRTLGLLLQGGIPVVTALVMARDLLGDDMRAALDRAMIEIRSGVALSEAMERAQLAPPVASDLLKIGEKTGDMGEKMIRIADFQDEETSRWADWFAKLFEPLLMLIMGLFIAFIVVLLYMPIFELAGSVQ